MRRIAPLPPLLLLLLPVACCAPARGAAPIGPAIRAADWPGALAAAAASPDPLALKLVTYFRLLHAGDASAAEIDAFLAANPDWPAMPTLIRRRDEALASEADDAVVLPICTAGHAAPAVRSGPALARCATAAAAAGQAAAARDDAGRAWVAGLPDADSAARFYAIWGAALSPADQAARFDALLAGGNTASAAAVLPRLAPADARVARARLALRAGAATAPALLAALSPGGRDRPALVLDELRALRRGERDGEAIALWRARGLAAEAAAPEQAGAFWAERSQQARRALRVRDPQAALLLADDAVVSAPEQQADAAFLAGFIALRYLHDDATATARFTRLKTSSAVISQARAEYWLARAAAARGDALAAARHDAAAAAWPTTYYGQLAILATGAGTDGLAARIEALVDPRWTQAQALAFAGTELSRAALLLVAWGDPGQARPFLQQALVAPADPPTRALQAQLALHLGLADQAVAAARRAGREGTVLAQAGWPMPVSPPEQPTPPAVALAIMRQESSFEIGAVSPSGARGLMQLMPATAAQIGAQTGQPVATAALTTDAGANMRLGSAYFAQVLDRYGGALPLAIAAYNAGPNRVDQWLAENGDPRGHGAEAMIDWIELIPFSETRNYVQRVIENSAVYRAKRHDAALYPVHE